MSFSRICLFLSKINYKVNGIMPGHYLVPFMVKVFPEFVCPYAKMQTKSKMNGFYCFAPGKLRR